MELHTRRRGTHSKIWEKGGQAEPPKLCDSKILAFPAKLVAPGSQLNYFMVVYMSRPTIVVSSISVYVTVITVHGICIHFSSAVFTKQP